jgi:hypothetical protein
MYVGEQVRHNTPLAMAQSFHIIAAQMLLDLSHRHPQQLRLPSEPRFGKPGRALFAPTLGESHLS